MIDYDRPQVYSRRGRVYRYAVRHAPAGGVTINGKFYPGGKFIPAGDFEAADPATKAAIEGGQGKLEGADFQMHHLESLPAGHTLQIGNQTFIKKNGGSWQRKGSNHWLTPEEMLKFSPDAPQAIAQHLGTLPAHTLPPQEAQAAPQHAPAVQAMLDAADQTSPANVPPVAQPVVGNQPGDRQPLEIPEAKIPGATSGPLSWGVTRNDDQMTPKERQTMADWHRKRAVAAMQEYRDLEALKSPTATMAARASASNQNKFHAAAAKWHQSQAAQHETPPVVGNPPQEPEKPAGVSIDPKQAIAGLLKLPQGTKVAGFERRPGDSWKDANGTPWTTDAMARFVIKKGQGGEIQAALQPQQQPEPPQVAPGQQSTTGNGSQGTPQTPDALHASLEALPPGTYGAFEKVHDPNTDMDFWKDGQGWLYTSAQFAQKHPSEAQAAGATQPQPQSGQNPKQPKQPKHPRGKLDPSKMSPADRDSLAQVAGMFGINAGDAQNLDRSANFVLLAARKLGLDPQGVDKTEQTAHAVRYLAQQQKGINDIVGAAEKMGYKGRATNLIARARGAQEHIIKTAAKQGYKPNGKFDRADMMAALQHLATSPATTAGNTANGDPNKFTFQGILKALETKAGGRRNLLLAAGALGALWWAFGKQQKRMFFDKAGEGNYRVMKYSEPAET